MFWGHWSRSMGRSSGPHSCTRPSKFTGTEALCCVFKLRILDFRCNRLTHSSVHIWDPQCHIIYLNMSHTTYLISSLLATYFSFCQEGHRRATESGTSWTSASFWRLSKKSIMINVFCDYLLSFHVTNCCCSCRPLAIPWYNTLGSVVTLLRMKRSPLSD